MKTRIGVQILFYNGKCYQSFGWEYFKPLGSLKNVIKMLDSFEVDEICITRPIKGTKRQIFLEDCNLLSKINSNTPITFGGGIRSMKHVKLIRNLPVERLSFNSAFINKKKNIKTNKRKLWKTINSVCITFENYKK